MKAIILPVSLFMILFSSTANAQSLFIDRADVDLTAERLDYDGHFVDFTDTGSGSDFLAEVGLINFGNTEGRLATVPITEFNGTVIFADTWETTVCGAGLDLIVTSARLSTVDQTLEATARLCNWTCDPNVDNYFALFGLKNVRTGQSSLRFVPLTNFSPEGCVTPPLPEPVDIDIKPGSDPNCFNINGHGVIPVAILGSSTFDVTLVDTSTLSFGGLQLRVRGNKGPLCNFEDSDGDTFLDLVCHFEDDSTSWAPGNGDATLIGTLLDTTTDFEGTDSICVVP